MRNYSKTTNAKDASKIKEAYRIADTGAYIHIFEIDTCVLSQCRNRYWDCKPPMQ